RWYAKEPLNQGFGHITKADPCLLILKGNRSDLTFITKIGEEPYINSTSLQTKITDNQGQLSR
ncbi:hypothetical protein, partial [Thalassolituus oleivorans]|uniref:hypothetical protein n=1 Tax=Thalassolituus oleivorans TaxID=187493 RepID=UPI0023F559F2